MMTSENHLYLRSTGETIQQLVEKYPKVIVSIIAGGGDTSSNGEFSSPIQLGFLYENGSPVGRIPQMTMSSHINSILGEGFIAIPKDKVFPAQEETMLMAKMQLF